MQERRAIKNTDLFIWLEENEFDKIIEKCNYKILNYQKDEYVAFRGDEIKGIYINLQGTLVAEMLKDDGNVKKNRRVGERKNYSFCIYFWRCK